MSAGHSVKHDRGTSQRAAGRQAVTLRHLHDQPAGRAHFPMQLPDGIHAVVVGTEAVRADHLGAVAGAMGEGFDLGAHLVQHHRHTRAGDLPGGLGSGKAGADDMDRIGHLFGLFCSGAPAKRGQAAQIAMPAPGSKAQAAMKKGGTRPDAAPSLVRAMPAADYSSAAASALASSLSDERRPEGAAMFAMTKLRSMVGLTPLGSTTSLIWIESPISRPVRSTVM